MPRPAHRHRNGIGRDIQESGAVRHDPICSIALSRHMLSEVWMSHCKPKCSNALSRDPETCKNSPASGEGLVGAVGNEQPSYAQYHLLSSPAFRRYIRMNVVSIREPARELEQAASGLAVLHCYFFEPDRPRSAKQPKLFPSAFNKTEDVWRHKGDGTLARHALSAAVSADSASFSNISPCPIISNAVASQSAGVMDSQPGHDRF